MPVLFKRNSLSAMGGAGGGNQEQTDTEGEGSNRTYGRQPFGTKKTAEPTESEKILAHRSQTQQVKLEERRRQQLYHMKVEAARRIQRAWRRYFKTKKTRTIHQQFENFSKEGVRRKRLRATQEEWERQIAALTIQLAWRKFYRRKLLRSLHPNRRQLLMWDPEVVALKQQALVNYIYNEQIHAPFWHPTLKAAARPLWFRFIPSAAAVSYNFAVDQYVPWVSRLGAQPPFPEPEATSGGVGRPHGHSSGSSRASSSRTESVRSSRARSDGSQDEEKRAPSPAVNSKKSALSSSNTKKKS